MVSSRKSEKTLTEANCLNITFEPVFLSENEDNDRIKRLSKQILLCIERAKKERQRVRRRRCEDLFNTNFDEIFGLK